MSEEDWFERAISEDDAEDADEAGDVAAPSPDDDGSLDDEDGSLDDEEATEAHADASGDGVAETDADRTGEDEPDANAADVDQPASDGDDSTVPGEADDETVAEELDDDGLFDEGFAEALDGAESDPSGGLESGEFDQAGEGAGNGAGGFGDVGGSSDGFDPGGFDAGGGFDEGGGFGDAGGGFDGFGGGGSDVLDDEELDSEIPRIDLGIEGLDEMIQGGVPARTLMVAIGSAGTGKTTFGLQFLHHGLENGENGVYITLEESDERVVRSATEKGFAFDEYVGEGSLAVVDLDPVEMATSLQTIGGELPRLVEEFDAERLVLDSVSLLEMMYDDRAQRRNEIYDFTRALKESGVTTMLTSEASDDSAYVSRHGIVEYLTDAVFVLQYVRPSDFRETRLAIEIQKIRDANHSRETKPYDITDEGIDVYRQANLF